MKGYFDNFCYEEIWFDLQYALLSLLCSSLSLLDKINSLTPNNHYSVRTAPLTSKRCILYIYSTNIGTEYF